MSYILIVDDHLGIQVLLKLMLEEKGYKVEVCSNGMEAVQKVIFSRPKLIIMDIKMPGMGGFKALQEISGIYPEIPIIMMSAYTETEEVKEARMEGKLNYFVEKPFNLDKVVELIEGILNRETNS